MTERKPSDPRSRTSLSRIKLRHLQCLLAVAQHRHLGRAAQALAISQPAVSKTLAELEDILGVPMFDRSRRGVVLTPQGQTLLGYAGSSLRTLREGVELVQGAGAEGSAPVAVGLLPTAAAALLPEAMVRFRRLHPRGRLQAHTGHYGEMLARLKRGELDLVLGRQAEPAEMTGLSFEPLYTEDMVLAVRPGHPLLAADGAFALARLAEHELLLPSEGSIVRRSADAFLIGHAIGPPAATVETISITFGRAYAQGSDAVWFVPLGIAAPDLRAGTLVRLPVDTSSTNAAVGLTLRGDAVPSQAVTALVQAIREAARAHRAAQ
ncbi:pca operon transcription factor PcaQ [Caldimonas tepidiphila]|uniref:pca operon transcription factor PcaQ n=1 Tax=Caldimonas tepidiphila TaxID=2315841 RepID=UPI000E5B28A2|nr:pca operon transcription factor PcaQ [Caldimonas tepidiphila]